MINLKYFFKGFASIKGVGSPAIALGASFIAIGALLKNLGFSIQESIFSTFLTYALPGSLVMAESMLIGASLINIFIAVWLVNARLYPMTVSLMPLLMHKNQPRWIYYLSCHFIAVSSWLIVKNNYENIEKEKEMLNVNFHGTLNILRAMVAGKVKRLIFLMKQIFGTCR